MLGDATATGVVASLGQTARTAPPPVTEERPCVISNQESASKVVAQPEVNLFVAVIVQAFKDITRSRKYKYPERKKRIELDRKAAKRWLESESDGPMSFKWYCTNLGLNYQWVRNKGLNNSTQPSIRRLKLTS